MAGTYSLPNPNSPATSDLLVSAAVRQNFQSIQSQINNADGAALNTKTVVEGALADAINPRLARTEAGVNYVVSGLNPSVPGSSLNLTIPSGIAYIQGARLNYLGATITLGVNRDTYLDIDSSGTITQVVSANNAAALALTANTIRIAKVVTSGTVIVQILQSSFNTAPVAPNTLNWFGFDSLGNAVYNTSPNPVRIGYAKSTTSFTTTSSTGVDITGMSCTVIVPNGRAVRITYFANLVVGGAGAYGLARIMEDGVQLQEAAAMAYTANAQLVINNMAISTPTAGTHIYKIQTQQTAAGGVSHIAAGVTPFWMEVTLD